MAEENQDNYKPVFGNPSNSKIIRGCAILLLVLICFFIIIAVLGLAGQLIGNNFGGTGPATTSICTSAVLPQSLLDKISKNKAIYQQAADQANVPWEFIAALHYRESTLADVSPNGDGVFQIQNGVNKDFSLAAAVEAGNKARALLQGTYHRNISQSSDEETIKLAFLSYNRGAMYLNNGLTYDQSPYVMNNFDSSHQNMRFPDSPAEPPATRGKLDGKLGAFTVFTILRGCTVAIGGAGEGDCTWANNIENEAPNTQGESNVPVPVPIWRYTGQGPNDKASDTKTLVVNKKCTAAIKTIFTEIYNSSDKPVIDSNTACYNNRGNNWSRHNWGVACDINPTQNWSWHNRAKLVNGACTGGSNVGEYWRPGDISPDNTKRAWSAGFDVRSASVNGTIAKVFASHGWGRGWYRCSEDTMHFSIDGGH